MSRRTFDRLFSAGVVLVISGCCWRMYVAGSDDTRDGLVFTGVVVVGGVAMYWIDRLGAAIERRSRRLYEQQRHALAAAGPERRAVAERPPEPRSRASRGSPVTHPGASSSTGVEAG